MPNNTRQRNENKNTAGERQGNYPLRHPDLRQCEINIYSQIVGSQTQKYISTLMSGLHLSVAL